MTNDGTRSATSAKSRSSNFPDLLVDNEGSTESGNKSVTTSQDGTGRSAADQSAINKARLTKRKSLIHKKRQEELAKEKKAHAATYSCWQAAKRESRYEHHETLKQKLDLQRQLIKAQQELGEVLSREQNDKQKQEREQQRKRRNDELAKYEQICKESLKNDRRAARRAAKAAPSTPTSVASSRSKPSSDDVRKPGVDVTTSVAPRRPHRVSTSSDLQNVTEAEEPAPEVVPRQPLQFTEEELASLPWHHLQLYQLYGREKADEYLHPKIEQKIDRDVNPRLREHMKKRGNERPDAAGLWLSLRDDSNLKLLKEDSTISNDLKIPDLKILLDERLVRKAHNATHKLGVMYRSAQNNEDRARILAYNNPIPDLNDLDGDESVQRYMPSWNDLSDTASELSYKKWLPKVAEEEVASWDGSAPSSARTADLLEEWSFMEARPRKTEPGPKLLFITEKDATVKGEFSKRRKQLRESKGIPEPATQALIEDAELASKEPSNGLQSHSAPASVRRAVWQQSPWQPLSLDALIEYKARIEALGEGAYQQGRPRMWSAITTYD